MSEHEVYYNGARFTVQIRPAGFEVTRFAPNERRGIDSVSGPWPLNEAIGKDSSPVQILAWLYPLECSECHGPMMRSDRCRACAFRASLDPTVCKRCGKKKEEWQVFCGAACSAQWEMGR